MERAYSVLQVKRVDAELRQIYGTATTPSLDRVGDSIDPMGVKCPDSVTLLLHHDSRLPVGRARFGKPTKSGVTFSAQLPKIAEAGTLKSRVDEAWELCREKILTGVSIGFRAVSDKVERLQGGGLLYKQVEILELSLVSVPANTDCTISEVRSLDLAYLNGARTTSAVATGKRELFPLAAIDGLPFDAKTFGQFLKLAALTHNAVAGLLDREDGRKASEETREKATAVMFELLDLVTKSRTLSKSSGGPSTADLAASLTPVFKTIAATMKRSESDLLDLVAGIDQRLTALERSRR